MNGKEAERIDSEPGGGTRLSEYPFTKGEPIAAPPLIMSFTNVHYRKEAGMP